MRLVPRMLTSATVGKVTSAPRTMGPEAEIMVGRRYLERGFLDTALNMFSKHVGRVDRKDWEELVGRLMAENRVVDVLRVCDLSGLPLPRQHFLDLGDRHLKRRDIEGAIRLYELATAERDRWERVVDALTAIPEQKRRAIMVAERHLVSEAPATTHLFLVQ